MKKLLLLLFLSLSISGNDHIFLSEEALQEGREEIQKLPVLPPSGRRVSLPAALNNAERKYFPPIIRQQGGSCLAASRVGYCATYLLNAKYNRDGSLPENRLEPHFLYNFFNGGSGANSMSDPAVISGFEEIGCMTYADYPKATGDFFSFWPSGVEHYLKALENRIHLKEYQLNINDIAAITRAKEWLHVMDDDTIGGLIAIACNYGSAQLDTITSGKAVGETYVQSFGMTGGHALTLVGYDDSICIDLNGDGKYTNDVDLNGDDEITLADYECGMFIAANSWGESSGNEGFVNIPYRLFAFTKFDGGVHTTYPAIIHALPKHHTPKKGVLEMTLFCNNRGDLSHYLSTHEGSGTPEREYFEQVFCLTRKGNFPMTGTSPRITIALDITEELEKIEGKEDTQIFYGIFSDSTDAVVESMKFRDYRGAEESITDLSIQTVIDSGMTWILLPIPTTNTEQLAVEMEYTEGAGNELGQLAVTGGVPPYTYTVSDKRYRVTNTIEPIPHMDDLEEQFLGTTNGYHFNMNGFPFYNVKREKVFVRPNGLLTVQGSYYVKSHVPQIHYRLQDFKHSILPGVYPEPVAGEQPVVHYALSNEQLQLRWDGGTAFYPAVDAPVSLAYRLHNSGRIDIYYENLTTNGLSEELTIGLTDGFLHNQVLPIDRLDSLVAMADSDGNLSISFVPVEPVEGVHISSQGVVTLSSESKTGAVIPIEVCDSRGTVVSIEVQGKTDVLTTAVRNRGVSVQQRGRRVTLNGLQSKSVMRLYSVTGRMLHEQKLSPQVKSLVLPALSTGMVILTLQNEQGRFLKQLCRI